MGALTVRGAKPAHLRGPKAGKAAKKLKAALRAAVGRQPSEGGSGQDAKHRAQPAGLPVTGKAADDVRRTLGTRKWRLFGIAFGPKKTVSEVLLHTDAAGEAIGASARVNGHWVALKQETVARLSLDQAAQASQAPGILGAGAQLKAPIPARANARPGTPKAALLPASPSPSPKLGRVASTSTHSQGTTDGLSAFFAGSASSSRTSLTTPPRTEAELTEARWQAYCDFAARPNFYATYIEVTATAQALGRNIRVIGLSEYGGVPRFQMQDFAGAPQGAEQAPLTVLCYLSQKHYEPLVGDAASHPLLQPQSLNGEPSLQQAQAIKDTLIRHARRAPSDGSCFFHSVAQLTGPSAEADVAARATKTRGQAVAFLRSQGKTFEVETVPGLVEPLRQNFMANLTPALSQEMARVVPAGA